MKSRDRSSASDQRPIHWRTALTILLILGLLASFAGADESKKAIKRDSKESKSGLPDLNANSGDLVETLSKLAEQGQADAQYQLGMVYLKGKGISKDYGQAANLLKQAADRGLAEAQHELGLLYLTGDGVLKDSAEAAKWIRMAADQGHADAQYDLGSLYALGDGVPKDDTEAAKWYSLAAEQDQRHAKYALERLKSLPKPAEETKPEQVLQVRPDPFKTQPPSPVSVSPTTDQTPSVPQNPKTDLSAAVTEPIKPSSVSAPGDHERSAERKAQLLKKASKGDPEAQFQLGIMYEKGVEITKDYSEMLKWFRKASKKGHQGAKRQLLKTMEELNKLSGEGVENLIRLAEQGDAWVQTMVGYRYLEGMGVPRDRGAALKWFRKAAEQGEALAQYNLGTMYWRGLGVPKDDEQAGRWYLKAAEQGETSAQYNLGTMYWLGMGVPKDRREAEKWFRKAAEQGSVEAEMALTQMRPDTRR